MSNTKEKATIEQMLKARELVASVVVVSTHDILKLWDSGVFKQDSWFDRFSVYYAFRLRKLRKINKQYRKLYMLMSERLEELEVKENA